jgi:Raf kinase inhibitor-like YbhB/YbcL family protein
LRAWRQRSLAAAGAGTGFAVAAVVGIQALLIANASAAMALSLTSSAFEAGEKIPSKYTCEGEDVSPPLAFAGVPSGTKSLALIIDDPDAPDPKAPKRVWAHWLVYNLPPASEGLGEAASRKGLPPGAVTGLSDRKQTAYHGPCPPIGRHRYFHKLFALDTTLPEKVLTKAELEAAIDGHVLAEASLMGTYQKGDP